MSPAFSRLFCRRQRTFSGWLIGYGLCLGNFGWAWVVEAALVAMLLANRDLFDHARRVASGLDKSLSEGRHAVAHIVDASGNLNEAEKRAPQSNPVAENFSDGVVAPMFYYVLFGLPGILAYKAVNTLDSMVGYRNERFGSFDGRRRASTIL